MSAPAGDRYCTTTKGPALDRDPPGVLTLVVPVKSVPRIRIVAPTAPDCGTVFTKGASPRDTLKTVPQVLSCASEQDVLVPPTGRRGR